MAGRKDCIEVELLADMMGENSVDWRVFHMAAQLVARKGSGKVATMAV